MSQNVQALALHECDILNDVTAINSATYRDQCNVTTALVLSLFLDHGTRKNTILQNVINKENLKGNL